jgi:hypothetical protein
MKTELIYETNGKRPYDRKIRIIHFNDAYNIESRKVEPCGGASRFVTAIEELKCVEPAMVLFSGDVFSPSTRKLSKYFSSPNASFFTLRQRKTSFFSIINYNQ